MNENKQTNVTINFNKRMITSILLIINCILSVIIPFVEFHYLTNEGGNSSLAMSLYTFSGVVIISSILMIFTKTEYFSVLCALFSVLLMVFEIIVFKVVMIKDDKLSAGFVILIFISVIFIIVSFLSDWKELIENKTINTLFVGGGILLLLSISNTIILSSTTVNYIRAFNYTIDCLYATINYDYETLDKLSSLNGFDYNTRNINDSINDNLSYLNENVEDSTEAIIEEDTETTTEEVYEETSDCGVGEDSTTEEEFYTTAEDYDNRTTDEYYAGCLFPRSSEEIIPEEDYINLDDAQLQLAINEIYARWGAEFTTQENIDLFSSMSWYYPSCTIEEAANYLSDIENTNIIHFQEALYN